MPFQLDTSGRVRATPNAPHAANWYCWADLTPFAQGYVEAMFASLNSDAESLGDWTAHVVLSEGRYREPRFSDLAPATVERIIADCADALTLPYLNLGNAYNDNAAGGACYWSDRQAGLIKGRRPQVVYLSDDGLIMLREVGQ